MGSGIIRSGLRKFGGPVGSWVADRVDDVIGKPAGELSGKTGNEESYDPETARLEETRRINAVLVEFSKSVEKKADDIERNSFMICREGIDEFLDEIDKINKKSYSGKSLSLNLKTMKRKLGVIESSVYGSVKNRISKKVSLDDSQCLEILKMEPGNEKENKMNEFSRKIFVEALFELSNNVKNAIDEQSIVVCEQIENRIYNVEETLREVSNKVTNFHELKQNDEHMLELEKVNLCMQINMSYVVLHELV